MVMPLTIAGILGWKRLYFDSIFVHTLQMSKEPRRALSTWKNRTLGNMICPGKKHAKIGNK